MQKVNVREARQQISRLLDAVAAGETGRMRFPDRSTLRAMVPPAKLPAAKLIREMRDERG